MRWDMVGMYFLIYVTLYVSGVHCTESSLDGLLVALIQFYNFVKYIFTLRNTFGAFNFQSTMKYGSSCMKHQSQAYWYEPSIWLIQFYTLVTGVKV